MKGHLHRLGANFTENISTSHDDKGLAPFYIDAFQSVYVSLFGELVP
jgi:hypothetical protein